MPKLFVSSVITGMEDLRAAAVAACESLDLQCLVAEDLPASPSSPQGACLQLVRDADGIILILGRRYGATQPSGKSATEEEFDEAARLGRSVFLFCTSPELDPLQERLRDRVSAWQGGQLYKRCGSAIELQREVTRSLRAWSAAPPTAQLDGTVKQNLELVVPRVQGGSFTPGGPWAAVSWVPSQRLHLGEELVFGKLPRVVGDLLVSGEYRLVDRRPETDAKRDGIEMIVRDQNRSPSLAAWVGLDGGVAVGTDVTTSKTSGMAAAFDAFLFLAPRDLAGTLGRLFWFVREVLNTLDPGRAVTSGRLQASLSRMGMRHLAEPFTRGGVPIPMTSMTGDRDRAVSAPAQPETVVRPQLAPSGQLTDRYLARFQRAYAEAQRQMW